MLTPEEQRRVCAAARGYTGTPWRGQGRNRLGIDCSGFVIMAFRDAGFEVIEERPDYRGVDSERIVRTLLRCCDKLPPAAAPMVGDVVVYGKASNTHVALLVDGQPLNGMHCPINGKVVEARFDPKRGVIRGYYRWRS